MPRQLSFWQRWKRGGSLLYRTGVVAFLAYYALYLPGLAGGAVIRRLPDPWNEVVGIVYLLLVFAGVLIFLPVGMSYLRLDAASIREAYALKLEPKIDDALLGAGASFEKHFFAAVERHLDGGDPANARRIYHEAAGVTWSVTDRDLANRAVTRVEQKLARLSEHLQATRTSAV